MLAVIVLWFCLTLLINTIFSVECLLNKERIDFMRGLMITMGSAVMSFAIIFSLKNIIYEAAKEALEELENKPKG